MENLDIDAVLSALSDPETAGTIDSIMNGMDEMQKIMNKFEKLVGTIDRMGLKAGIMRMAGAKMGVDVDTPLGGDKTLNVGVEPLTAYHEAVFKQMNSISEDVLKTMMEPQEVEESDGETEPDDC